MLTFNHTGAGNEEKRMGPSQLSVPQGYLRRGFHQSGNDTNNPDPMTNRRGQARLVGLGDGGLIWGRGGFLAGSLLLEIDGGLDEADKKRVRLQGL